MKDTELTVSFYTLGCKVNQYESEALGERMAERGFTRVGADQPALVSVVNTCTVTNLSDRKSRQMIRRARKNNPHGIVAAIGCYSEVNPRQVSSMKEVDIMLGSSDKGRLPDIIIDYIEKSCTGSKGLNCGDSPQKGFPKSVAVTDTLKFEDVGSTPRSVKFDDLGPVSDMTNRSRALIKIQDGCNGKCAYCVIPMARGPIRSRDFSDTIDEAKRLVGAGYRELVITGVNLALYGRDFADQKTDLLAVLEKINSLPGDFRMRLGSLEPTVVDADFLSGLMRFDKLCPSLHLSVQSGSDKVLRNMGRNYNRKEYLDLIKILRQKHPAFGISTDFIVGFPGEDEEDFLQSVSLAQESCFHHIHVFQFSGRPGTAAELMEGKVSPDVSAGRSKRLIRAGEETAKIFRSSNVGLVMTVIPEKYDKVTGCLEGLSENNLRVFWQGSEEGIGRFVKVLISGTAAAGLTGQHYEP